MLTDKKILNCEAWVYQYDPETKWQSMEWRHSTSPRAKKLKIQKPSAKVLVCWNVREVILLDFLEQDSTMDSERYTALLKKLQEAIRKKSSCH